jgi:hypothetical protein
VSSRYLVAQDRSAGNWGGVHIRTLESLHHSLGELRFPHHRLKARLLAQRSSRGSCGSTGKSLGGGSLSDCGAVQLTRLRLCEGAPVRDRPADQAANATETLQKATQNPVADLISVPLQKQQQLRDRAIRPHPIRAEFSASHTVAPHCGLEPYYADHPADCVSAHGAGWVRQ